MRSGPGARLIKPLLVLLLIATLLPLTSLVACCESYPPLPAGTYPGSVTVTVSRTKITTDYAVGALVSIVNGSNTSMVYSTAYTDAGGRCKFQGISPLDGAPYKFMIYLAGYENHTSEGFTVGSGANSFKSYQLTPLPTTVPTLRPVVLPGMGTVEGRVYLKHSKTTITGATVYLVSAADLNNIYASMNTDDHGNYRFEVNGSDTLYQIWVSTKKYPDVYSLNFKISEGVTTEMDIEVRDPKIPEPTPVEEPTEAPPEGPTPTLVPLPEQPPNYLLLVILLGIVAILAGIALAVFIRMKKR